MYEWLAFSLMFLGVWLAIFAARPVLRKEMFWVSLFTMPFALTEPLFVPEYWNPPSLFNLAATTRFDIESFIFCFAIGGVASVLYESLVRVRHEKMDSREINRVKRAEHYAAFAVIPIAFAALEFATGLNSIYSASAAMLLGSACVAAFRPDLLRMMVVGGLVFLALYFIFFLLFTLAYPGIVQEAWNLPELSGILVLGVPLEELLFASTFGMMWSGIYEFMLWYRVEKA
jgi:hypothetical protein